LSAKTPARDGRTVWIGAARRAGLKDERSTDRVAPSRINSAIASPVAGALRIPQTLWPVATYAPGAPGTAPISGSPSCVTGRKQACLERMRDDARIGEMRPQSAFNLSIAPSSGTTRSGPGGRGELLEIAQTYVVPSTRGKKTGDRIAPVATGHSRNSASEGIAAPVSKTRLCPFSPNTVGRGSHCAATLTRAPSRSRPRRPRALRRRDRHPPRLCLAAIAP
jgi:hypothetical protein